MSLPQPPGGVSGTPPFGHLYRSEDSDLSRPPRSQLLTLPLLSPFPSHEPQQQEPPHNHSVGRQNQSLYNMSQQPPDSLYLSHQQDQDATVHHIYHVPPPPPANSYASQTSHEPNLTLPQRRPVARVRTNALPYPPGKARSTIQRRAGGPEDGQQLFMHSSLSYPCRELTVSESPHRANCKLPIYSLLNDRPNMAQQPLQTYTLRIRQEPVAARVCGFGERRIIDPPPILEMIVIGPNLAPTAISNLMSSIFPVIFCTLWDPETDPDAAALPDTSNRKQRRLIGTLAASPFVGKDEHGVEGCFFTFPDLSVRTPGKYSLKFDLVILDPQNMRPVTSEPVADRIWSSPFQVFKAKDFRGMRSSTALTKTLRYQGCYIPVKRGKS